MVERGVVVAGLDGSDGLLEGGAASPTFANLKVSIKSEGAAASVWLAFCLTTPLKYA